MNSPLIGDQVAGDEIESAPLFNPELRIWAEFAGGDPRKTQPKEITVCVPICDGDQLRDYLLIIQTTLRELARVGTVTDVATTLKGTGSNVIVHNSHLGVQ